MQEIRFDRKPFIFTYVFNARKMVNFSADFIKWLHEEHYYFEVRTQNETSEYEIKCDDFIDAAKIQTFIDTH